MEEGVLLQPDIDEAEALLDGVDLALYQPFGEFFSWL